MITLKKILVPTDFSETSEVALQYARALAETFGAALHVLHVIEPPPIGSEVYIASFPDVTEQIERDAKERLQRLFDENERQRLQVVTVLMPGDPFEQIVGYAKDHAIDLIVMGTHGRGAVAHMLMGSVAEKVVRRAPCPVFTVRHPQHEFVAA